MRRSFARMPAVIGVSVIIVWTTSLIGAPTHAATVDDVQGILVRLLSQITGVIVVLGATMMWLERTFVRRDLYEQRLEAIIATLVRVENTMVKSATEVTQIIRACPAFREDTGVCEPDDVS